MNQPKSTVELIFMCPRGLFGPPAVTLTKKLKFKKRLLLRCIHHFKSDPINIMDHMRISGTQPSSVILSQMSDQCNMEGVTVYGHTPECHATFVRVRLHTV